MQTSETANLLGIKDRGVLEKGYKADINIIDYEGLTLHEPEIINDLLPEDEDLFKKLQVMITPLFQGKLLSLKEKLLVLSMED